MLLGLTKLYLVLFDFTGFELLVARFTGCFLDFNWSYLILGGFTGSYLLFLPSFDGFYLVLFRF